MKILLLAPQPFYQNRGTPIAVKLLAEVLANAGHHIDILTYHEGEDFKFPNISIHRIPKIPGIYNISPGPTWKKLVCDVFLFGKCLVMVHQNRFDIIHAVEESAFMAALLRYFFKISYVYDMDSSFPRQIIEKYPILHPIENMLKRLERIIIKKADGVVAVCKYIEEIARECDPKSNILRLEDISLLQKSTRQAESLTDTLSISNPVIMYVGNLEAYQGIDLLLESFQRVIQKIAAVNLIIIGGSSEDIKKYRRKSVMLEIHKRTHFIGPRPTSQLESYLKQADILISPRIKGGNTPMKIYSYLDSGKPVLATRLSTHTQVLDDKIAVLTLPDPNSMAEGIISLIADKKFASQIAANARERVKTNFTRDVFKKKLIGFYENIESTITVHKAPHVGGMQ